MENELNYNFYETKKKFKWIKLNKKIEGNQDSFSAQSGEYYYPKLMNRTSFSK